MWFFYSKANGTISISISIWFCSKRVFIHTLVGTFTFEEVQHTSLFFVCYFLSLLHCSFQNSSQNIQTLMFYFQIICSRPVSFFNLFFTFSFLNISTLSTFIFSTCLQNLIIGSFKNLIVKTAFSFVFVLYSSKEENFLTYSPKLLAPKRERRTL